MEHSWWDVAFVKDQPRAHIQTESRKERSEERKKKKTKIKRQRGFHVFYFRSSLPYATSLKKKVYVKECGIEREEQPIQISCIGFKNAPEQSAVYINILSINTVITKILTCFLGQQPMKGLGCLLT